MKHKDFEIGKKFLMSGKKYVCTDIGTRVVVVIEIGHIMESDSSWYKDGPPYAACELVLDEYDFEVCEIYLEPCHEL